MTDKSIEEAAIGLKAAIESFIKKYEKRFQRNEDERAGLLKNVSKLVRHTRHILNTLTKKLKSLEYAIDSLRECWKEAYQYLIKHGCSNINSILQHILQCYIRLGDGVVLLASGECRHEGDMKSIQFKSQLTKNELRKDGYTMLYSKDLVYSGFGWDEFFDSQHGVQARLVGSLRTFARSPKLDVWDVLLTRGAQMIDTLFDNHETNIHLTRKSLQNFRERLQSDLTKLLPNNKVHFGSHDKMEFLEVCGQFKLQRRANEFQVKDNGGVLPDGWTLENWRSHMALPSKLLNHPFKKLRQDVCSEDKKNNGLYIQEKKTSNIPKDNTSSLSEIKASMGIDATDLEASRDILEAEQGQTYTTDQLSVKDNIINKKSRASMLRRGLQYAIQNTEDPLDVWDAREHLRRTVMELGQDLIVCGDALSLADARICFEDALDLVLTQEAVHKDIIKDTNDDTESAWLIQRNFFLLKGNAHVNIGISVLKLSFLRDNNLLTIRKLRNEAANAFLNAKEAAREMKVHAIADRARGANSIETRIDELDATQLEALALQNYAQVLWHNGTLHEAIRAFTEAITAYKTIEISARKIINEDVEFMDRYDATLAQCRDALASVLEFSERAMKKQKGDIIPQTIATDFYLYTITLNFGKLYKSILVTIESLIHQHSETSIHPQSNRIGNLRDIESRLGKIEFALQEISKSGLDCVKSSPIAAINSLTRNDLGTGMVSSNEGATKRYLVTETDKRNSSKDDRRFLPHEKLYHVPRPSKSIEKENNVPYMKWGDEILSSAREGCQQNQADAYPCAAPPFPGIESQ